MQGGFSVSVISFLKKSEGLKFDYPLVYPVVHMPQRVTNSSGVELKLNLIRI